MSSKTKKLSIEDISKLHNIYVQNILMFPVLLEELSKQLNVSTESLRAVGVGLIPLDEFGSWSWVFPERDHKGNIIGLSTRYTGDNKKMMVRGSKRGLFYPYNENALTGKTKYEAGRCSWIRLQEAGIECPVCGKPDWCLVSSDYADSKGPSAVICSRTKEGSVYELPDCGHIHILDKSRQTKSRSGVLQETSVPILVVEGVSDVLAAMDLGFVAIGRPTATGGMKYLKEMPIAGKTIWIMGENDAGAGQDGMEKTFISLSSLSKNIVCIMPPEGVKDLRQWCSHDITAETLTAYVQKEGVVNPVDQDKIIQGEVSYVRLAEQFVASLDNRILFHQRDWWQYGEGRYHLIDASILESDISKWFNGFQIVNENTGIVSSLKVTTKLISEVLGAVRNLTLSRVPQNVLEPLLIDTSKPFDCGHTIMFKNGLLDVTTNKFTKHSDNLFTTSTLLYDYDPDAVCPDWDRVVPQWFEGEAKQIALLQEWFGYNMIATNYLEQLMFVCGESGSGKGTAVQTLGHLLGGNFAVIDTQSISKDIHALASLIGKYACLISEEGKLGGSKSQKVLSVIKIISGNDDVAIRRMFKTGVPGRLFCRITYSSNELPIFTDEMQSLFRRLNLLEFKGDFRDNPDTKLKERLRSQLPGIANWAIEGLRCLLDRGRFTLPEVSRLEIEEIKIEAAPLKNMLETYLVFDVPDAFLTRRQLFELYLAVCDEDGVEYRMAFKSLRRRCKEAMPRLGKYEGKLKGGSRGYKGVGLTKEAIDIMCKHPPH